MRRLTLTVTPEQAGRTVKSLLRRELRMADGAIARVKTCLLYTSDAADE